MSKRKINKSAVDGRIVSDEEAAANPETTYSQTVESNKRFCLRRDDDCHWYLLPFDEELLALFRELVEKEDGWADDRWQQFEDRRIDGYTDLAFENPVEV
jgi:hypothetical protein